MNGIVVSVEDGKNPNHVRFIMVSKRLFGIARRWHGVFHLPYHQLTDIYHEAWLGWLERLSVEDLETRFKQVNSHIRRYVIKQIWGKVPPAGVIREERPLYFPIEDRDAAYQPDYIGQIMIHDAIRICQKHKKTTSKHEETLSWMMGFTNLNHMRGKDLGGRIKRLKNHLEAHGMIMR